ncbi:hypothetical protein G4B88_026328 [Cannabis sativa]|uniref:PPM-type phosphatase domain-containing protein n=1 Tax=Cannabis sativa TaxID=3483 RepID=A0A7J6DL36_CANSA|nr:hypothetical protein G4B88_026328 [Cannabis sativa]
MVLLPSIFDGLAKSMTMKKGSKSFGDDIGKETANALSKEAKKNELISRSSGIVKSQNSDNLSSIFSKRGKKGINQDCLVVWEEFGCQEDMVFCGIFDGHGQWGHLVSKRVRESLPSSLLCNWQNTLSQTSLDLNFEIENDRDLHWFGTWKESFFKTYAAIDQELKHNNEIDTFLSANVGDSRAVLATTSENGNLVALQLTIDFKPNIPEEAERIIKSKGRVFCLEDEPGVYRVWRPNGKSPGLAISRAFGDYSVKEFGLISTPHVTHTNISTNDHFVILASDGKEKSARRLVECAARAWKSKRRGIAQDDISAICLFFHSPTTNISTALQPNDFLVSRFSTLSSCKSV